MARSGRGPGRQRSRAIRAPITITMAQSRPFLIPAGGQCGYQLAGVPAWLPAGAPLSEVVRQSARYVPANCSTIRAQNAGRSSGQRLEVMFWSVTTSWSTTLPPALRMSVLTLG